MRCKQTVYIITWCSIKKFSDLSKAEVFGRSQNIQPMLQLFCLSPSAETLAKCKNSALVDTCKNFLKIAQEFLKNSSRMFQEFYKNSTEFIKNSSRIPEEIPIIRKTGYILEYLQ